MKDNSEDTNKVSYGTTVALRIESEFPVTVRQAYYPNGIITLQGGYSWQQGVNGGIVWRDLPTVNVDEDGQEKEPTK